MIWLACVLSAILLCIYFYKSGKVDRTSSIGKCVLITGCDSGLGLSMALTAHAMGFKVVAICLSDSSYGALLLKEKCHENVLVLQTDVTIPDQVNQAVENVSEHLLKTDTQLWAVINNAGVMVYGQADWQTEEQVLGQVGVNLVGVWRVTKAFLPLLRKSIGRIINVSSTSGTWPIAGLSIYCATKHAVEGFSHALRAEMIPLGVKVILVNPGNWPASTQIMARQSAHAEAMKRQFSAEDWELYSDYFQAFQRHLQENFGQVSLKPLEDLGLTKVLESCLLLKNPTHYYKNLTFGFQCFVWVFKILPVSLADRLYLRLWGKQIGHKLL